MLGHLPAAFQLDVAILATTLAWGLGFLIADRRLHLFAASAIGCFVVLIGYTMGNTGAPAWLVMAVPTLCDIGLLWYVMRTPRKMAVSYVSTWIIYVGLHVALSAGLQYDYLIPPWHLHA